MVLIDFVAGPPNRSHMGALQDTEDWHNKKILEHMQVRDREPTLFPDLTEEEIIELKNYYERRIAEHREQIAMIRAVIDLKNHHEPP